MRILLATEGMVQLASLCKGGPRELRVHSSLSLYHVPQTLQILQLPCEAGTVTLSLVDEKGETQRGEVTYPKSHS